MRDGALKTLFLSNGIFVFAGSLLGPLYAVFVQKLDNGVLAITTSWTVFLLSTTLFTFIISRVGDKFHKDELLIAGYIVRALVWLSYILITNLYQLLVIQAILGIGEALGTPSFGALFAEHIDKGRHVREYADWQLISNLTNAAGTVLGGIIVVNFGFKFLFLFMSLLAVVSLIEILHRPKKVNLI